MSMRNWPRLPKRQKAAFWASSICISQLWFSTWWKHRLSSLLFTCFSWPPSYPFPLPLHFCLGCHTLPPKSDFSVFSPPFLSPWFFYLNNNNNKSKSAYRLIVLQTLMPFLKLLLSGIWKFRKINLRKPGFHFVLPLILNTFQSDRVSTRSASSTREL